MAKDDAQASYLQKGIELLKRFLSEGYVGKRVPGARVRGAPMIRPPDTDPRQGAEPAEASADAADLLPGITLIRGGHLRAFRARRLFFFFVLFFLSAVSNFLIFRILRTLFFSFPRLSAFPKLVLKYYTLVLC